jgi:hypothetical protein
MRAIPAPALVLACALLPAQLAAQATADRARLAFSVGIGQTSGGGTLWSVAEQPIQPGDTVAITRLFRRSLAVAFAGTYFPGKNLGITVEAQLLGLGTSDRCELVAWSGGANNTTAEDCASIDGSKRPATSVALSVGGMFRIASDQPIHPFIRANVGLVLSPQSFIRSFPVYADDGGSTLHPYLGVGGGAIAVIGRGYQVRVEVRDNWVTVPRVASATSFAGLVPHTRSVGKHFLTFLVGFDVVLERKRGRRY